MRSGLFGLVAQAAIFAASAAPAAQVYSGDLVVLGNACVGFDCAPSAPSEALVLSENNTRIAFGSTDGMRMTANQSSNGSLSGFFFDASQSGTYSDGPVEVAGYALNGTVEADGRLKVAAADFATLVPRSAYAPGGTDTTLTLDPNALDGNAYIYLPAGSYASNGSTGPYFINMGPVVAQDESGNPITASGTYTTHAPFVGFLAGDGGVTLGGASTATAGQVSVGSSGATRRISNVADGIEASDAITVGQLSRLGGDATAQSQRIDRLENDLTTMSAMSVAVSALTANPRGTGASALAIGLGHYDGVSAVAAGVVFQVASHVTYRVGFADTTRSDAQITVVYMVKYSLPAAAMVLLATGAVSHAAEVVSQDIVVMGSACVGSGCTTSTDFGYNTIIVSGDSPTILFNDTSSSSAFPTTDWSVGTNAGVFAITNVDTGQKVMQVSSTGNGVALGAGSTLVEGAISVGSETNKRRITNVADGVAASDVATYGQLLAAMDAAGPANNALIQQNEQRVDKLSDEVSQVGAMSSAFSALSMNPRGEGDNFVSIGLGNYAGTSALAVGSYHFLDGNRIFLNTGVARALDNGAHTAVRLGVTFGG